MELDLQNPLTSHEDQLYDAVPISLFTNESDHVPCLLSFHSSDSRFSIRRAAISLISSTEFCLNLDPYLVYLAITYIDRFLSKQDILDKRAWIPRILVVASLSLAAKMINSVLPFSFSDLQRDEGFDFDEHAVRRMETIMLSTLQWRMRSITPFSFLPYLLSLFPVQDSSFIEPLKRRASDIIFNVQPILEVIKYKSSVIAASALLCAVQDLNPFGLGFSVCQDAIFSCECMNRVNATCTNSTDQDTVSECLGVMQGIVAVDGCGPIIHETETGTLTQVSVLDRQGTSTRSDEAVGSDTSKRRSLNNFCGNPTTLNQMSENSTMLNF